MTTDVARLNIEINSADALKASSDLNDLAADASKADRAVGGLGARSKSAGRETKKFSDTTKDADNKMGGMSKRAGQAGVQIQQLVGQIQGGQNAMQAFSMQAADLGIVLGAPLVGVIVSLGAVVAGTLAASFRTTAEEVEKVDNSVESLIERIDQLTIAQARYAITELQKQKAAFLEFGQSARATDARIETLRRNLERFPNNKNAEEWSDELRELESLSDSNAQYIDQLEKSIADLEFRLKQLKRSGGVADALNMPSNDVSTPRAFQPWQVGIPDEKLVNQWLTRVEQEEAESRARRNEELRKQWLASQEQPWMVGVADPEDVKTWLDRVAYEEDQHRQAQLEKDREAAAERERIRQVEFNAQSRIANNLAGVFLDAAERKSQGEGEAAKKSFEVWKNVNSALILSNGAAAIINSLKYGDPATKWFEAAAVGAETFRQLAANQALDWQGGGGPTAPQAPSQVNNNTSNTSINLNVTGGGDPNRIVAALEQYLDNDGKIRGLNA